VKWVFKVKHDEHLADLPPAHCPGGWEVHHMDIKLTFLNGDMQEEVYIEQSMGFIIAGKEHKVLKLQKAMYGLHQVSHA
jgi:hypothetical protein